MAIGRATAWLLVWLLLWTGLALWAAYGLAIAWPYELHPLLLVLVAFTCALAVLQDALWLAIFGIVGLTIRANEVDAAAAMLDMARIPHREANYRIVVPASAAHGVFIELAED